MRTAFSMACNVIRSKIEVVDLIDEDLCRLPLTLEPWLAWHLPGSTLKVDVSRAELIADGTRTWPRVPLIK